MNIPGVNVYALASQLIGKKAFIYFEFDTTTTDARGLDVTTYKTGVPLTDNIQPVPRRLYQQLGLDLDKYYIMIYTDNPLRVVERGTPGDQLEFNSQRFQLLDNTDWKPQDGWQGVMAVRLNTRVTPA